MTTATNPARRCLLQAAAVLGGAGLALPPARQALAKVFEPSPILDALRLSPQWLNSRALDAAALRGKVVVVCFWTYSCINSLRVLPYLRAWKTRYGDRGLEIVGVHTPEFAFEKDLGNVRQALSDLDVCFPVVLDSDYRIWRAFENNAWPSFHFIDADGRALGHVDGEGGYDKSERLIQKLLTRIPGPAIPGALSTVAGAGPQASPDWSNIGSGESYIGYRQADAFTSPGGQRQDVEAVYSTPDHLPLNRWALSGGWVVGEEYATLASPTGAITHRFHARDLHMVLAPSAANRPARFRVRIDGAAPGADHGWDVAPDGTGILREPRMYQLIRQARPVADRTFEITFLDPGARAYVFTFG